MVYVKLTGPFAKQMPNKNREKYWAANLDGETAGMALGYFDFREEEYTVLVNNMCVDPSYVLKDGDVMMVMPFLTDNKGAKNDDGDASS